MLSPERIKDTDDLDDCITVYVGEQTCCCPDDDDGIDLDENGQPICPNCGRRWV